VPPTEVSLDPSVSALLAAVTAWLGFTLLRIWSRSELAHWLSAEQADLALSAPSLWRIAAFLLAGGEVLLLSVLQGDWPSLAVAFALGGLTGALTLAAMIDLRCQLLPDRITWLVIGLGLIAALLGLSVSFGEALLGGLIGYGLPSLLTLLGRRRHRKRAAIEGQMTVPMGRGDFALIAGLGVWLGFSSLPLVLVLACLAMLPFVVWGMFRHGWQLATALPFGPALAFAGLALLPWTDFGFIG
jgi:prepilin signal peptidase PulO-like enzyme (type II secretory pathway)